MLNYKDSKKGNVDWMFGNYIFPNLSYSQDLYQHLAYISGAKSYRAVYPALHEEIRVQACSPVSPQDRSRFNRNK